MSVANLTNLKASQSAMQMAALKMEADKADQLRVKWEEIENKNVEKLATLLSNVEKITKRANSSLCKAQVFVGDRVFNSFLGMGLAGASVMAASYGGIVLGQVFAQSAGNLAPLLGGCIGIIGVISVGVYCVTTADKYEESIKKSAHSQLFQLLRQFADSTNPQLNTCIQQLYNLGADQNIPGPFWKQCITLLQPIETAAKEFKFQQNHFEHKIADASHNDPQVYQAFESHKSFAQRHQDFVEVKVESTKEDAKENVVVQPISQTIKI